MRNKLSFLPTVVIFILFVMLYWVAIAWITDLFASSEWVWTVGLWLFFIVVFEIPSRIGPKPFDTPLSSFLKLSARDKKILLISILFSVVILIVSDVLKDRLNWLGNLGLFLLCLLFLLGPTWFFGSPQAKKLFFQNWLSGSSEQK